jgi:hypothetical protein
MPRQIFSKFSFGNELSQEERDSIYEAVDNRFAMGSVHCGWEEGNFTITILGERLIYTDLQWLHRIAAWDGGKFVVNAVEEV